MTKEIMEKSTRYYRKQNSSYFTTLSDEPPKPHCIPVWAIYVTSYAQIKLHKIKMQCGQENVVYCDTDSVVSYVPLPASMISDELGDVKLEKFIDEGIYVRSKMYAIRSNDNKYDVKIKGVNRRLTYAEFLNLYENNLVESTRFCKFREALNRDLIPNEIISANKLLSLEDTKRDWGNQPISFRSCQKSTPHHIVANLNPNNTPMMMSGEKSNGAVAPTRKYANINIIEPSIPIMDDV